MQFAHVHTDDPLGLATAGDVVLTDLSGGIRRNFVEMLSELGVYIATAAVSVRPVDEFQISYELRAATLTIPIGALVNMDYVVTALSVSCDSGKYPTVNVTAIKFSSADKFLAPPAVPSAIAITGGFGLVNKWGVTGTIDGISSSMSVSMQNVDALEETGGDFLDDGYCQYGFKQEVAIESFVEVSTGLPVGAQVTSRDAKTGRNGLKTYSVQFFKYL